MMPDKRYQETQNKLVQIAGEVRAIDLRGFLARIRQSENIAPFIDPTLYRDAQNNLEAIKRLAETLQPFQEAADQLVAAVIDTAVLREQRRQPMSAL